MVMGCPSGMSLARLDAGDLDADHTAMLGSHAGPCPRCTGWLRELAAARAELLGDDPAAASLTASRQIAARVAETIATR
jgi:hypothetical protein